MAQIEVTPEVHDVIKKMAEKRGCTKDEAAEYLIAKGVAKWKAEHKYMASVVKDAKPRKAAKAKKASKAKGPLARKAKAAKTEAQATA